MQNQERRRKKRMRKERKKMESQRKQQGELVDDQRATQTAKPSKKGENK
jgi:hypothetical protein